MLFSYLFLFRKVKIKRVVTQLNSNIEIANENILKKAAQEDLVNVSKKADEAIYRLGEGRVSMGWVSESLSINFYVDGIFIGGITKTS